MKMKIGSILLAVTLVCVVLSCHRVGDVPDPAMSYYYWKTTFKLDDAQRQALKGIGKIYLRLFDVVPTSQGPQPNATISFEDTLPTEQTIVPTIFIDYTLFRTQLDVDDLARRIVDRVEQMSVTHGFEYKEIQFDCDWTASTEKRYFAFLKAVREHADSLLISTTIRLHQLQSEAPPVDYGVLMLYNTGDFRDGASDHNPILDARDVEPYLKYLKRYRLPLCAAYPCFEWKLLYHEGVFRGIVYNADLNDRQLYMPTDSHTYRVLLPRDLPVSPGVPDISLSPGDVVKHWRADGAVAEVWSMVESQRSDINKQVIYYHLSEITKAVQ